MLFFMQGNAQDYHSPCNSLLNDVLRSRVGIPISLAVLHMAVGRRAGLHVSDEACMRVRLACKAATGAM